MTYPYLRARAHTHKHTHTHTHTHTLTHLHSIDHNKKDWQECTGTVKYLTQAYQCHSLKSIAIN
jgi:hypothetical protein